MLNPSQNETKKSIILGFGCVGILIITQTSVTMYHANSVKTSFENVVKTHNKKIEAGKIEIEHIETSLIETMKDTVSIIEPEAIEKGLAFKIDFDLPIPEYIYTNPVRLKQILINLIHNTPNMTDKIMNENKENIENKLSGKILLAEDNIDNQRLLQLYISRIGANLTIVANGEEAIKEAQKQHFDLILMDKQMPVMDGMEAVKLLRQAGYKKPIVALTANALQQDRDECMQAGCDDFLPKPINKKKFIAVLSQYLPVSASSTTNPTTQKASEPQPTDTDIPTRTIKTSGR